MKTEYDLRVELFKEFEDSKFTHYDVGLFLHRLERDYERCRGLSRFKILIRPARYRQDSFGIVRGCSQTLSQNSQLEENHYRHNQEDSIQ